MGALRLFLAVSVLVRHLRYGRGLFGFSFLDGELAVECFFIISGFYMALVLNEKYNYKGSYGTFIQQRFLRLYPLYFVIGVLIVGIEGVVTYFSPHPFGVYAFWLKEPYCVTFLSSCYYALVNLAILGLDSLWFFYQDAVTGQLYLTSVAIPNATPCFYYTVNGPSWTLAVEMTFYLLAPFLVRKPVKVQAAFMLASFALRCFFFMTTTPKAAGNWLFHFSPSLLCFFMAGSIGYRFYASNRAKFEEMAGKYVWVFWACGALCLIQGRVPLLKEYFSYFFVPAAILLVPFLFALTRSNHRDRLLGELSYPYYLIHYQIIVTTEYFLHENYNFLFGPVCALVTLGLACFFYQVIELRTEHYRERLFQK